MLRARSDPVDSSTSTNVDIIRLGVLSRSPPNVVLLGWSKQQVAYSTLLIERI